MRLSFLPIFVFLMPLAEIAGFIVVGKMIGVWATLGLVVLSVLLGAALLRIQGIGILQRISAESRNGGDPGREMVHGAMIVVAAYFLMLSGFISDIIGFLLFIPAVREFAWSLIGRRVVVRGSSYHASAGRAPRDGKTIDLDAEDYSSGPNPSSPWLKRGED